MSLREDLAPYQDPESPHLRTLRREYTASIMQPPSLATSNWILLYLSYLIIRACRMRIHISFKTRWSADPRSYLGRIQRGNLCLLKQSKRVLISSQSSWSHLASRRRHHHKKLGISFKNSPCSRNKMINIELMLVSRSRNVLRSSDVKGSRLRLIRNLLCTTLRS